MLDLFKAISLVGIAIGSYTDIKTLEVPDYINYSLVAFGLGGNLIYTLIENNPTYILRSVLGLIAALIFGFAMYYTGQWGGGDSKMLFGLGALLGISYPFQLDFFLIFLINLIFAGAAYGLLWIIFMGVKYRKKLKPKLKKYMKQYSKTRFISSIIVLICLIVLFVVKIDPYFKMIASLLFLSIYVMNYLMIVVKSVEDVAMIKYIDPEKLTEGDWIVDPIYVNNKLITGPKDLGIKKEQISQLLKFKKQGKINKIKVKYGIPFVPSFLIAFILTLILNKVIFLPI
ncbi:hypothetical protein HN789_02240 [archaeon]|jgi:Flp pilus assembly protein protease CpaA|nr:hypothetical protein [archaeon]MBT4021877.1 hypothetical protein [archaeon]MBT4272172.1 hypothetical protein [archaeon]MBT4460353.1 hypothetical protein [archaeon]MBT4858977.1 hypothetical protein [archaeon]